MQSEAKGQLLEAEPIAAERLLLAGKAPHLFREPPRVLLVASCCHEVSMRRVRQSRAVRLPFSRRLEPRDAATPSQAAAPDQHGIDNGSAAG